MSTPVSVLILTKNEEELIRRAIDSASWADEVIVLDSGSTDHTREIAAAAGATVHEQAWLGWSPQRQRAAELARNDWVFVLEADEIVTPELARSIQAAMAAGPDPRDGYVVDRRDEFLGELMLNLRRRERKQSFVRLFHRQHSGYDLDMPIHEEVVCPGRTIELEGFLLHWRNSSLRTILDTYNRNSDIEAGVIRAEGGGSIAQVAAKPVLRFLWVYVRCGHWRLGSRGFILAWMHAFSEFARQAKAWEARHARPTLHPPASLYRSGASSLQRPLADVGPSSEAA